LKHRTYKTHFGSSGIFFFYFVTTNTRLQSLLEHWAAMTKECPQFRQNVYFKLHGTYKQIRPTAHMVEEPFLYVTPKGDIGKFSLLEG
jgi:hypothetical protein